ncbi:ABC transporter [Variovorax sp. WS11]|uniref:ABC transporter substrate-binding protein n=1 Tax=Variovorax sp. WS11 TaxID=1105204 RepID=UPI000D0D6A2D|nr:ABC transporter substrate-binding protein [Variovorax sp. WS11]NDZ17650.1 ABC transporter substrate-binding protein [Variovorax sp. WS11]PSL79569.1 ABC transporter [Variovorax sp. WS11]
MKKLTMTFAGLILGLAAAAVQAQPVKIGLLLPYRGAYASGAATADKGFELAVQEVGGKVAGRPIEIVRADDELTPAVGVQKFNKLIHSDKVDVVAGVIHSGVAIALTELAEKSKTPLVVGLAFADEITGKFCNPYVARTSYSANAYHYAAGQYWARQGMKPAVTLGPDYAAGRAFLNAFKRGFEDGGGKVSSQLWSPFQTTKDWSGYLATAKATGAQFIYSFYAGAEAVQVVKQHAEFGMRSTMPLIGDQFLYDETLWPAWGDLVIGTKHVTIHTPDIPSDANKAFVSAYTKKYGAAPDVYAALGYDNARSIILALEKVNGNSKDGAAFMRALNTVSFAAPRGHIKFNKDNDAVLEKLYLVEVVKGDDGKPVRKMRDSLPGAADLPGCTKPVAP